MKRTGLGLVAAMLLCAGAAQAAEPAMMMNSSAGKVWTDSKGMTLYTYDKDSMGKSDCYGKCAVNWPPLKASASAKASGNWSVVKRKGGGAMWAYDGKPLYTFIGDKKPGDVNGDGKAGVWHVAKAE
ncbi:MAG: COG4315 family predicted lipoprotein [Rhizobiaceae bacterium]